IQIECKTTSGYESRALGTGSVHAVAGRPGRAAPLGPDDVGGRKGRMLALRVEDETFEKLELAAGVKGRPISELVRAAIAAYLEALADDRSFQEEIERFNERARQAFRAGTRRPK